MTLAENAGAQGTSYGAVLLRAPCDLGESNRLFLFSVSSVANNLFHAETALVT
jgi:hypothetical protein